MFLCRTSGWEPAVISGTQGYFQPFPNKKTEKHPALRLRKLSPFYNNASEVLFRLTMPQSSFPSAKRSVSTAVSWKAGC